MEAIPTESHAADDIDAPHPSATEQLLHDVPVAPDVPVVPSSAPEPPAAPIASDQEVTVDSTTPPAEVPFDFQVFLDQMKTKSAEPVSKYLRSFLTNFSRKLYSANDQVKLVRDFLEFITARMLECDVWKSLSQPEFENATEAMEKLVMNRFKISTYTPQIDYAARPVTTDDLEKDHVLHQRILLFSWIEEKHLDVPTDEGSQGFTTFAQKELTKINHYKAPRDKLICILNCCKVIFGLLRHLKSEESADAFIPVLIFVVLKSNPRHLLSNVEYINRFRNPAKLQSEAGYYLSSLMGAVSFIETMDHSSLSNITQEEFERNVENAIANLPPSSGTIKRSFTSSTRDSAYIGDESAQPLRMQSSTDTSLAEDTRRFLQRTGETISKPMSLIGKIFADAFDGLDEPLRPASLSDSQQRSSTPDNEPLSPIPTAYQPRIRPPNPTRNTGQPGQISTPNYLRTSNPTSRARTPDGGSMDFSAMQREIDRAHDQANAAARETLKSIFPTVEDSVADMVLEATNGDVGLAIDQLLEMMGGGG